MERKKIFKVSDLKLAAAISLTIPVSHLNKIGNSKIAFIFDNSVKLQEIVALYWRRELQVDALDYANQIDSLKTQVYEELAK